MISQVFKMKFESKIAALLDAHLLFAWDAGTKQLIGCKWVMETVDSTVVSVQQSFQFSLENSVRNRCALYLFDSRRHLIDPHFVRIKFVNATFVNN